MMHTLKKKIGLLLGIAAIGSLCLIGSTAHAQIAPTVQRGDSGATVLAIQTLLATEPLLYPAGLETGYFGPLTESAVKQFQLQYGLAVDGVVGPNTALMMNAALKSSTGLDIRTPIMKSNVSSVDDHSATVAITTQLPARAYVYYDVRPITGGDSTEPFALPYVSGTLVMDPVLATDHRVVIEHLAAHTTYYVVALTQDSSGNVSANYLAPFTTSS